MIYIYRIHSKPIKKRMHSQFEALSEISAISFEKRMKCITLLILQKCQIYIASVLHTFICYRVDVYD